MNIGAKYLLNDGLAVYQGIFLNNGFAPDDTNPNKHSMSHDLPFKLFE